MAPSHHLSWLPQTHQQTYIIEVCEPTFSFLPVIPWKEFFGLYLYLSLPSVFVSVTSNVYLSMSVSVCSYIHTQEFIYSSAALLQDVKSSTVYSREVEATMVAAGLPPTPIWLSFLSRRTCLARRAPPFPVIKRHFAKSAPG